jgi:hypothetical protein
MSREALRDVIAELPYGLRERIEGYVSTVAAESEAIFDEAQVPRTPHLYDALIFFAGIRKLWSIVDANYQLMTGSMDLIEGYDALGFSVGATRYSRGSDSYWTLRNLHTQLRALLLELDVMPLMQERSLAVVVERLAERSGRRS